LLGETKIRTGQLDESVDCFKRAIRLNSKRGLYYKSLAVALHFQSKSKEVLEVLKKAIEIGKKDTLCLSIQGIHQLRIHKVSDSINTLNLALKKNPNNPIALYNLALAYMNQDEVDKAINTLEGMNKFKYYVPIKEHAKKLLKKIG
jgi:cytochrome c-type biogenesis protein CcmH/NrfG